MQAIEPTRVLLIEDDEWLADVYVSLFEAEGYQVSHVAFASAAMTAIDEQLPDVVVADVLLSGTTILALLHELQSHPDTALIPVILCTNLADSLEVERLRSYGVRRVVDKVTMQPVDLVAAVRSVL